jgi:hypothetical protein
MAGPSTSSDTLPLSSRHDDNSIVSDHDGSIAESVDQLVSASEKTEWNVHSVWCNKQVNREMDALDDVIRHSVDGEHAGSQPHPLPSTTITHANQSSLLSFTHSP